MTPPPLIIACPDCTGHAHVLWCDGWIADVVHDAAHLRIITADVTARRAVEDWIIAQLARVTLVGDYAVGDYEDVVAVHSVAAA